MAADILLISENAVRTITAISDNVAGKYLRASIQEAQAVGFCGIVGDTLYAKLCNLVDTGDISLPANAAYKALLDKARYYLAYSAAVELVPKVTYKVANAGVVKTPDEKVEVATEPDMAKKASYYQAKADRACVDVQNFILNNRADYPELTEGDCHRIQSNLYSAATCGIWLGGPRGKWIKR